jgi:hypothetical protein
MFKPLITLCCEAAGGDAHAGILLYRIIFWMQKAKVVHHGVKWIAKSAETWCEETARTFDQYRRAIALLRKLGLVQTEQHLFGGRNITHVRLTEKGAAISAAAQLQDGAEPQPKKSSKAQPEKGKNAQLLYKGEKGKEDMNGEHKSAFADAHAGFGTDKAHKSATGENTHINKNQKNVKTIPEINEKNAHACDPKPESPEATPTWIKKSQAYAASMLEDTPEGDPGSFGVEAQNVNADGDAAVPKVVEADNEASAFNDPSPGELAEIWRSVIQEKYPGYHVPTFTKKELGQFKHFITRCPPGKAAEILEICVREWSYFTHHAKTNAGAYGLPANPALSFVIKYDEAAVNFALQAVKQKEAGALFDAQKQAKWKQSKEEQAKKEAEAKAKAFSMTKQEYNDYLSQGIEPAIPAGYELSDGVSLLKTMKAWHAKSKSTI